MSLARVCAVIPLRKLFFFLNLLLSWIFFTIKAGQTITTFLWQCWGFPVQGAEPGSGQPLVSTQAGGRNWWRAALLRRAAGGGEAGHELAMDTHSPERKTHPKCHGQQGREGTLLFCSAETPPAALHPALGSQHRKDMEKLEWSREDHKADLEPWRGWGTSPTRKD